MVIYLFIINKTIRSSGRAVIYQVFLTCLAESEAGQILSQIDNVYQRTGDMTGIYPFHLTSARQ